MAVFNDTFTEATATTPLQSHTPDTGTSWTQVWQSAAGLDINANYTSDTAIPESSLDNGVVYSADATYPSANYEVQFTLTTLGTTAGTPVYIFIRLQDIDNLYAVRLDDQGGTNTCQLYKKVTGTWTALGSAFNPPADGSVCVLGINGTSLYFKDDGVQVASATDSDISATGKAGLGAGGGAELVTSTDNSSTSHDVDNFTVTDLGAGGTNPGWYGKAGWF